MKIIIIISILEFEVNLSLMNYKFNNEIKKKKCTTPFDLNFYIYIKYDY